MSSVKPSLIFTVVDAVLLYICDIWCIYGSRPYGYVSAAFWATLSVILYVVMTAHEY